MKYLIILLLSWPLMAPPVDTEFLLRILDHDKHYDKFVRDAFGCLYEVEVNHDNCKPERATINYRAFAAARKAAMKLYDLREKDE